MKIFRENLKRWLPIKVMAVKEGHRIEVFTQGGIDFLGRGDITRVPIKVYVIDDATLTPVELRTIQGLVTDPITDISSIDSPVNSVVPKGSVIIERSLKPGVTDPEGEQTRAVIERELGRQIGPVSTGRQYLHVGDMDETQYALFRKKKGSPVINDFIRADSQPSRNLLRRGMDHWWTRATKKFYGEGNPGIGFHFPHADQPIPPVFEYLDFNVSNQQLEKISEERELSLNLEEMTAIKDQFFDTEFLKARKEVAGLDAMPTDAEAEAIAQTWSEHCCHKKFNAIWEYTSLDPHDEADIPKVTNSVFNSIIRSATEQIISQQDDPYVVSVFSDNAGVVTLDREGNYTFAHKVETHNFPSSLEGFGGANTGTGGVIRDPMSTGKFMDPCLSQYAFCVAPPDYYSDLSIDIQSPGRTLETVVAGVEDYGNKFGIPTSCGKVQIDPGWLKCAVYVGCGAVNKARTKNRRLNHVKEIKSGYIALSLGGGVGKDGIHGATASSTDIGAGAEAKESINQSVQIGNPIVEKCVAEVMKILNEKDYIEASQDCGAGGWNSAVGELTGLLQEIEQTRYKIQEHFASKGVVQGDSLERKLEVASEVVDFDKTIYKPYLHTLEDEIESGEMFTRLSNGKGGIVMDLTHVREKYKGLMAWEKLISEAQEREVIVVKPEKLKEVLEICRHYNVEATKLGIFNDTGNYHVIDQDVSVVFLPTEFLHRGLPQMKIKAEWEPPELSEPDLEVPDDITEWFHKMLGRPNIQNYDWIRTRYDHEVGGGSCLKPLVGKGRGTSDATASNPILERPEVVIESLGSNPWQGDIDTYHMGRNNVVDAIGRIVAAGGSLEKIFFNGNTTCPKPEQDPYIAAQVMRMLRGSADAEIAFGTPRISGKDSTSMQRDYESTEGRGKQVVKAKPDLLMSGIGIVDNDSTITSCDFKIADDRIYVIGKTRDELGASEYYQMHDEIGKNVPKSDFLEIRAQYQALESAIKQGFVNSAQYIGKGGLAEALSRCSLAGDIGALVELSQIDEGLGRADKILFSESTGRFVVSVNPSKREQFEKAMEKVYCQEIGRVYEERDFKAIYESQSVIDSNVDVMRKENMGEIRLPLAA
jgi:phosphoribosylformylglycinamidine synthase